MAKRLTLWIMVGLVLGIVVGYVLHRTLSPEQQATAGEYFSIVTTVFLRLIKMIIAPLVFATLVSGIAHMGDTAALGRVGARTIGWFLGATVVSLSLGLILYHVFEPAAGMNLTPPEAGASAGISTPQGKGLNLKDFITNLVPTSIFDAMATNAILPIVVFSCFFGVAIAAVGEKAAPIARGIDALVHVMLVVTGYVMQFAPFAVFAAIAAVITKEGLGVLIDFGAFIASFYVGLLVLWVILIAAAFLVIGRDALRLPAFIRQPVLIAFSTASSEAAYPKTLEQLERFGVPNRIASFVLPLGYSFNLDGSMMYMTYAALFIASAYGFELSIAEQITMLLILMVSSKGMAAVPRASLVVIAATLGFFGIPEAGLLLILGIDQFLDMGRSATNVVGNAVATSVVAKWEGVLGRPADHPEASALPAPHPTPVVPHEFDIDRPAAPGSGHSHGHGHGA